MEHDAAVAFVTQLRRVQVTKRRNQIGLAVKVKRVLVGGLYAIEPDGAAAFRLARQIARLLPLEGFLQRANALDTGCGVEDQLAKSNKPCLDCRRMSIKRRFDGRLGKVLGSSLRRSVRSDVADICVAPIRTVDD